MLPDRFFLFTFLLLFFCLPSIMSMCRPVWVCYSQQCVISAAHETAWLKSIQSWKTDTLSSSQTRLKPSPSYCSKATVWLLVSQLGPCICAWGYAHACVRGTAPPGIPFLFPTDFRAALKFFLQSSEEGERDEWKGEDVCVGWGWGQRQRIVEGEEWKMLLLLLFFTPALSACRHFCQMVFLREVGCVGGVGKNCEFDYIILDICNHSLMNNKTW